ncbi:MAG: AAA family ATPase [Candidatus Gastranaerophilaceae bacterium]
MTQKISTIIITEQTGTLEVLKLYLEEFGSFNFLASTTDYSKAYNAIKELDKSLVIVDISEYPDPGLNFISKVSHEFPGCRIIALSDRPAVDLVVKVMRAGAKEFLSLPLIKNELFEVLAYTFQDLTGQHKKKNKCRVLTVFSNKGGIGKTSIASNLALELAKITKENVALIDLNFQLGDITTFFDLKPSFNISYMLQNLDKINEDFLLSTLEKYKDTSLYVLADPPYFKQAEDISPKQISKLFEILKETFSYVVVDTSAGFDSRAMTALENSDLVLLVTIVNLPALRNCQRCLELFEKSGFDKNKIQILVNRYMENDEIKAEDVEEVLGRKIFWKVPNNYFTMMSAINKGVPVSEINSDSNVARSYRELALTVSDSIYKQNRVKKISYS